MQYLFAVLGYKHFLTTINYFWWQYISFRGYIPLSVAIYYFWRLYTTFDGYMLLLTTIYYIRRLYITFDVYILLLALPYCDFVRIQVFAAISFICGLNIRLEFKSNLLALIQFCFFCSSMVSHVNFNLPFWKRFFIRITQILKMWNYQVLKKADLQSWAKYLEQNRETQ